MRILEPCAASARIALSMCRCASGVEARPSRERAPMGSPSPGVSTLTRLFCPALSTGVLAPSGAALLAARMQV